MATASTSSSSLPLSPLPPLPPPGFSSIPAAPGSILLPLTISNKCGQSFRWRAITVWESVNACYDDDQGSNGQASINATNLKQPEANGAKLKQETFDGTDAEHAKVKLEDDEDQLTWSLKGKAPMKEWTEYSICLSDRVVFLRQDEHRGHIYHRTVQPATSAPMDPDTINAETAMWLQSYLALTVPLSQLYEHWSSLDPVFARFATTFRGIRMLRQDPWECMCAFICSSNNNIARIGQMVQNLCTNFSPRLLEYTYRGPSGECDDEDVAMTIDYHPFPSPRALAQPGVEQKLRDLGFGYRAKYIHQTAKALCEEYGQSSDISDHGHSYRSVQAVLQEAHGKVNTESRLQEASDAKKKPKKGASSIPEESFDVDEAVYAYLRSLRTKSYPEAREALQRYQGIGPKVADCILLMSLDQPASIPVDRHVFQFAHRWYKAKKNARYEELADFFRELWGEWAGWAHSVLFTADLRSFKDYDGTKKEEGVEDQKAVKQEGEALPDPSIRPKIEVQEDEALEVAGHGVKRSSTRAALGRTSSGRPVKVARSSSSTTIDEKFPPSKAGSPPALQQTEKPASTVKTAVVKEEPVEEPVSMADRVKRRSSRVSR